MFKEKVLSAFDQDPGEGIRQLKSLARRVALEQARLRYGKAQGYLFLKALYVSPNVKTQVQAFLKSLWSAWVDVDVGEMPGNPRGIDVEKFTTAKEAAKRQLDEIEEVMRRELQPAEREESDTG
jgi:hypothetical protein